MIAAIAFTDAGEAVAGRLPDACVTRCPPDGLAGWAAANFPIADALVFIGSAGIAVRAIAPHVASKTSDPAVIVIDEQARFVVPILSGHIGQANALARQLADAIGATAVITTATDGRGLFAVDDWATRQGLYIANPQRIKAVSAAVLAGQPVKLASDFPVAGPLPAGVVNDADCHDVIITCRASQAGDQALRLVPRAVTAGVGCRKGVGVDAIEQAFAAALGQAGYEAASVAGVCSIDLKAAEPGLLEFCRRRGLPLRTFSAEQLRGVGGEFTPSQFVESVVGVDNVCERAAVLGGGYLVAPKLAQGGVTVALALREPQLTFEEA